jgi:ribose 5-phosphate isomerase A
MTPETPESLKKAVALAALDYIEDNMVIGVGTGTTINYFIENLAKLKGKIAGTVASSKATEAKLNALGIPVLDLNGLDELPLYVDSADAFNGHRQLIKGGGGALTREKILAFASKQFLCILDASKRTDNLGSVPVPIEVIPMARSMIAREIVKLGGRPQYREGFVTDNGNVILDVHHWSILDPMKLENTLNNLPGVVSNGIFAERPADQLLISTQTGMTVLGLGRSL